MVIIRYSADEKNFGDIIPTLRVSESGCEASALHFHVKRHRYQSIS
ncbi:hypothetical protein [Desulfonema magnum]|uniref:Uncharacterized protein n=1 Tax=Desulfonema magnum TaxID=45655 RepID=A0A975BGB7_9BACT|nr:hypothetical protein [Desulfonema magnum]QTA84997.1 Uncharacterized protein dnm_010010 [Desulfonema magnum]